MPDALQSEAIKSASNSVLLLASPGTGKTRVLRARMAYLLLRERVPPEKILAVTFTQHAAHELQRHVHRMVDGALEGAWVGSFHATCLRMLRENHQLLALPAQVPVLPPSEQLALVRELLRNSEHTPRAGAGAAGVLRCITLWKERGQMPPDLPPPTGRESACEVEARRLYPMYEEALRARGVLDVAGLTLAALRLLRMEPRVLAHYRERFQHVLVDELQDTSVVQYDWLHLLSGGTARKGAEAGAADVAGPAQSIFAAADDDQAIYSWRGADRANVLRFCRDFGAVQVLRLPNSYRCPAHVYAAAQALLPQSGSLLPKKAHTTKPFEKQTRVQLRGFWDSEEEAKWVAAQLHAKRASGLRYDQMAVLVRSAEHARAIGAALRAARLPVAFDTEPKGQAPWWWASADAQHAVSALRLVRSPADDESALVLLRKWARLPDDVLDAIRLSARRSRRPLLHAASAVAAALPPSGGGDAAARLRRLISRFASWQRTARAGGLHALLPLVLRDYPAEAPAGAEALRQLGRFGGRCKTLAQLLGTYRQPTKLLSPAALDDAAAAAAARGPGGGSRPPSYEEAGGGSVRVLTVHRSKGLEWEVVFLPGWEEGMFPMRPAADDAAAAAAEPARKNDWVQEEWRLAYVALTRCHSLAAITFASRRLWSGQWRTQTPSSFLKVLPSDNVHSLAPNRARPYYRGLSGFKASMRTMFEKRAKRRPPDWKENLEAAVGVGWTDRAAREVRWEPGRIRADDRPAIVDVTPSPAVSAAAAPPPADVADVAPAVSAEPLAPPPVAAPAEPVPTAAPAPVVASAYDDVLSAPAAGASEAAAEAINLLDGLAEVASKIGVSDSVSETSEAAAEVAAAAPSAVDYELEFVWGESGGTADGASLELEFKWMGHADSEEEEGAKKGIEFVWQPAGARGGGGARARRRRRRGGGGRGRVSRRRDRVRLAPRHRQPQRARVCLGAAAAAPVWRRRPRRRRPAAAARPDGEVFVDYEFEWGASSRGGLEFDWQTTPSRDTFEFVWQGGDVARRRGVAGSDELERLVEIAEELAVDDAARDSRAAAEDASAGDELPSAADEARGLLEGLELEVSMLAGGGRKGARDKSASRSNSQ